MTARIDDTVSTDTSGRTASTIMYAVLIVALIARQVFAVWERYDGSTTYAEIQEFGAAYWPMNLFVFGPSFAIGFTAQAILAWQLGRGRGRWIAGVGAATLLGGGVVFALVATAHALPYDWAANHGILDEPTGTAVVDAFAARGTPLLLPAIIGSQIAIALGSILTAVGGRLSRTIPTWMLITVAAFVLAFFVVPAPPGSVMSVVLSFGQLLVWAVLGWFGWRAGLGRAASAPIRAD